MASLQPYVSNVPLVVSKNLRFDDSTGIPVTQMLPIGMNGNTVNDSPTTGYISRIGAVLSEQIDLYNNVVITLNQYNQDISDLQSAVAALQISGNTIPVINGKCFTGNALSPITTVTELIAVSACSYNAVLGTPSNLALAIVAETPAVLNPAPAFSIQAASMQSLSGWVTAPTTIADSVNNLWVSYLDSRAGIEKAINAITPTCAQNIIDFLPVYIPSSTTLNCFFSGYSFIPNTYVDAGSTLTIKDNIGGVFVKSFNIVNYSIAGAGALAVNISGTALSLSVPYYTIELNSVLQSEDGYTNCTKYVIKSSVTSTDQSTCCPNKGSFTISLTSGSSKTFTFIGHLTFSPGYVGATPNDATTASYFITNPYFITPTSDGATMSLVSTPSRDITLNFNWIAYK